MSEDKTSQPTKQIIPVEHILPNKLFIIPLLGKPIFPGIFTPLMIASQEDISVIEQSLSTDSLIGLILVKTEELEARPTAADLYTVGTVAKIIKKINLPDGGNQCIHLHPEAISGQEIPQGIQSHHRSRGVPGGRRGQYLEVKALTRAILSEMKQISENNPLFSEEMRLNMVNIDHPGKIADSSRPFSTWTRGNSRRSWKPPTCTNGWNRC